MSRFLRFAFGPSVLCAALLAAGAVRADLPWSAPGLPWRIQPGAVVEGRHRLALRRDAVARNMDGAVDTVSLRSLRLERLSGAD